MVDFPSTLDLRILQAGYREEREINVARFAPDIGPPKLRRRASISQTILHCTAWLAADERDDFDFFYYSALKDGTLPFDWTHPRNGQEATFVFEGEPPRLTQVDGSDYFVEFTLRVLDIDQLYQLVDYDFATLVDSDGKKLVTA